MKLYIQADIEGVAGMTDFENRTDQSAENLHRRLRLRKLYTAEVNAAAQGAFAGGAEAVTIWDSHGAGDSVIVEELDDRVELISGKYQYAPWLPFYEIPPPYEFTYAGRCGEERKYAGKNPNDLIDITRVAHGIASHSCHSTLIISTMRMQPV